MYVFKPVLSGGDFWIQPATIIGASGQAAANRQKHMWRFENVSLTEKIFEKQQLVGKHTFLKTNTCHP